MSDKAKFSIPSILNSFISQLPEGHTLTGFTFEVSHPMGKDHIVRCNGGTYQELLDTFEGSESEFVAELIKGYNESLLVASEKFQPIVNQEEKTND